jgi:hypothetical protein
MKTDYVIVAQGDEGALVLARRANAPWSPARVFADDELHPVKHLADILKFGYWAPYEGRQDALVGQIPNAIFS